MNAKVTKSAGIVNNFQGSHCPACRYATQYPVLCYGGRQYDINFNSDIFVTIDSKV